MTQEEKDLLLKDLCVRLPYEVMIECSIESGESIDLILNTSHIDELVNNSLIIKTYLRPMSSMTEEEKKEYESLCILIPINYDSDLNKYDYYTTDSIDSFDWLNAHHFDYRGLIEKGLALEAPVDMYILNNNI